MQKEEIREKVRNKGEAEALAEGTGKLVNQDRTEAPSKKTSERADNLYRYLRLQLQF